jgi:hypothetical protein
MLLPVFAVNASADPRLPDNPDAPKVDVNEQKVKEKYQNYQVSLINAKGEMKSGSLMLTFDSIDVNISDTGANEIRKISLSSIDSIEFIRWKGTEVRKNAFVFYPSQINILLSDKKTIECFSNIKQLNKLGLRDGKRIHNAYAYFFDYREKNVWRNSGQADMLFPETNPHENTVVRITFNR